MKIWSKFIKSYGSDKRFNLGPSYSKILIDDPKLLSFVLSRYKFVSKILEGKKKVLEVGCGESFGSPLVEKAVNELYCCDYWEPVLIENKTRFKDFSKFGYRQLFHLSLLYYYSLLCLLWPLVLKEQMF